MILALMTRCCRLLRSRRITVALTLITIAFAVSGTVCGIVWASTPAPRDTEEQVDWMEQDLTGQQHRDVEIYQQSVEIVLRAEPPVDESLGESRNETGKQVGGHSWPRPPVDGVFVSTASSTGSAVSGRGRRSAPDAGEEAEEAEEGAGTGAPPDSHEMLAGHALANPRAAPDGNDGSAASRRLGSTGGAGRGALPDEHSLRYASSKDGNDEGGDLDGEDVTLNATQVAPDDQHPRLARSLSERLVKRTGVRIVHPPWDEDRSDRQRQQQLQERAVEQPWDTTSTHWQQQLHDYDGSYDMLLLDEDDENHELSTTDHRDDSTKMTQDRSLMATMKYYLDSLPAIPAMSDTETQSLARQLGQLLHAVQFRRERLRHAISTLLRKSWSTNVWKKVELIAKRITALNYEEQAISDILQATADLKRRRELKRLEEGLAEGEGDGSRGPGPGPGGSQEAKTRPGEAEGEAPEGGPLLSETGPQPQPPQRKGFRFHAVGGHGVAHATGRVVGHAVHSRGGRGHSPKEKGGRKKRIVAMTTLK